MLGVLARPFTVEGAHAQRRAPRSASASIPSDGRDFGELLKNADAAMYHAKESGSGTLRFFAPALNARAVARLRLENELRRALARGELVLHWQPVAAATASRGPARRWSARKRWCAGSIRQRGLLCPSDFVPLAEDCGLIRRSASGRWSARCRRPAPGSAPPRAASSGSRSTSRRPSSRRATPTSTKLEDSLQANQLDGRLLELEVTERVLMSQPRGERRRRCARIGELGVRFAIDDFGTGYSSLAYLRQLPIDKLKIDRSFLRELDTHAADQAIVRTIAALAADPRHLRSRPRAWRARRSSRALLALGCDEWQGHYFSPPLDVAGFEAARLERSIRAASTAPDRSRRRTSRSLNQAFARGMRRGVLRSSGASTSWQPVWRPLRH